MFERRKRNWNYTGTQITNQREGGTHGITWENEHHVMDQWDTDYNEGVEIESGWEEEGAECFVPAVKIRDRHIPKGQSEQGFSDRESAKNARIGNPSPLYPGLQKRPDFQEQHKKLTIYVDRELIETMEKLKKERYIQSYSWLINMAIKDYLNQN